MAGIDNNTVLYLRGDSFKDLSLNPKTITNNNVTLLEDESIGKCLNVVNGSYLGINDIHLDGTTSFTIEWTEKINSYTHDSAFLTSSDSSFNIKSGILVGFNVNNYPNKDFLYFSNNGSSWDLLDRFESGSVTPNLSIHKALVFNKEKYKISLYENGKTIKETSFNFNTFKDYGYLSLFKWIYSRIGKYSNIRISNIARYTEDFTPPTQPYNSITINKTNQTDTNIEFNIEKLGQEIVNKVEVLINGIVSETYTDSYDNIDYLIDTELCVLGNNDITIRVTYDDTYTEELSLTHKVTVNPLPLETPLLDTVERVKLLTKSKQNEKNMLSNILTSKNVEVTEEDKMSDLIGKVDLLGANPEKLYLYKYGDECVDVTGGWVNTVSNMENTEEGLVITNSTHYSTVYPNNMVDLSEFNTLCMEYKLTYGTGVILATSKNKNSNVGAHLISSTWDNSNVPLNEFRVIRNNINSLSGSHYTCVIGIDSSNYIITKIWLEK